MMNITVKRITSNESFFSSLMRKCNFTLIILFLIEKVKSE
jgi:hypothetical protein